MVSAVVFAYHNVGVRCLSVLLDQGVRIPLVVTHQDNPKEEIWFASVAELARLHDIPVIAPDEVNDTAIIGRIATIRPDFLFSFYYRQMLKAALLGIPQRGAYNMHGSLLPKYRGRVPVNWAIIKGERETGATLHEMVEKPDAGRLVDQQAVPILEDDIALDVFNKVTVAAEITLSRALPGLIAGTALLTPQTLSQGSYFGGRKPEDGIIDWGKGAREVHDLVRAVAPTYPGASTTLAGRPARILRTLRMPQRHAMTTSAALYTEGNHIYAACGDGGVLRILSLEVEGEEIGADGLRTQFGLDFVPLGG